MALQLVSSGVLFFTMFTLAESTRWLLHQGRVDEAWRSLTWIRASDSETVVAEFKDMKYHIAEEKKIREGLGWRELLARSNQKRLALGTRKHRYAFI